MNTCLIFRVFLPSFNRSLDKVVATTSKNSVHLFDLRHTTGLYNLSQIELKNHVTDVICGVKFANTSSDTLFVSTTSGQIFQYDLRTNQKAGEKFELEGTIP